MSSPRELLGMAAATFLRRHWQRTAHLSRKAIPDFAGFLDRDTMVRLALRDDVESRLVVRAGSKWDLHHGPFRRRDFTDLGPRNWTLLIQGVNLHSEAAATLLGRFSFVPHCRLDDLMVSYAVPGGGVGPHFDSYDVFLLQGPGRRLWRIGTQEDLDLQPNLPLKILRRFREDARWILEPGDMLYLPPRYAHDGVAVTECLTYSIGFRAPTQQELASEFLVRMAERIELPGRYSDPSPGPAARPGRIPARLVNYAGEALGRIRWRRQDIEEFLGSYLSEPKAQVCFEPPAAVSRAAFVKRLSREGLRLHRKSSMLYAGRAVFLNGETYRFPRGVPELLEALSDDRTVPPAEPHAQLADLLHEWHGAGYVLLGKEEVSNA